MLPALWILSASKFRDGRAVDRRHLRSGEAVVVDRAVDDAPVCGDALAEAGLNTFLNAHGRGSAEQIVAQAGGGRRAESDQQVSFAGASAWSAILL